MSLKAELVARILANGPISLADYMSECLLHPKYGYYTTKDPFGANGDFTTAPEISQIFGEVIGLCLAQGWIDQGSPAPFALVELGPGRGTLMADILRTASKVDGFLDAAQITLMEASQYLREVQSQTLSGYNLHFSETAQDLPDLPLWFVANEFFDALPVRQFQRMTSGWSETLVGVTGDRLCFGRGPDMTYPPLKHRLNDTKEGDIVEHSELAATTSLALGERIEKQGGMGLVIDYGDWRSLGDTVQALHSHQYSDILENPGGSDLTAHVDFETLAHATPSEYSRLTTQGVFLERLGITDRARVLAKGLGGQTLENHIQAHRRLTHPNEMGNLFKVLGFFAQGKAPPAGLET